MHCHVLLAELAPQLDKLDAPFAWLEQLKNFFLTFLASTNFYGAYHFLSQKFFDIS